MLINTKDFRFFDKKNWIIVYIIKHLLEKKHFKDVITGNINVLNE